MIVTKKSGVSLIELVTVLAIIMVLAAILLPVFVRARESAQRSASLNNLKQIHLAMTVYRQDWEGDAGSAEGLGLPPLSPFSTAEAALPATEELWFSPCGRHKGGPSAHGRGRLHAVYDFFEWRQAYAIGGESTPYILDFHCNDKSIVLESPFQLYRVHFITLMGSASNRMTYGKFSSFDLR